MREDPALIGHRTVTRDAVATFGSLTGDYARIHFDHALGEASVHGRGFAHGLLSASWALGALTLHAPERTGCGEPGAYLSGFRVRFDAVVGFGDTLALRWRDAAADPAPPGWEPRRSEFECLNQEGRVATRGAVAVQARPPDAPSGAWSPVDAPPSAWPGGRWEPPAGVAISGAEDLLAHGPRGASRVRTVTEADVVNFANFTGELNPLYLDALFAGRSLFGERIAPSMLCFCLGFGSWLRELLRLPMAGGESAAGHLGDRWRFVAPVRIGDTLEVRHRPLSLRRTRSRPRRGILTWGLQLLNQRSEVVQQGEVDLMLGLRDPEEEPPGPGSGAVPARSEPCEPGRPRSPGVRATRCA